MPKPTAGQCQSWGHSQVGDPSPGCQTRITRLTHQAQGLKESSNELKEKVIKAFQLAQNWEGDPWPRLLGLPSMLCSPAIPADPPSKLFLKLKGNYFLAASPPSSSTKLSSIDFRFGGKQLLSPR